MRKNSTVRLIRARLIDRLMYNFFTTYDKYFRYIDVTLLKDPLFVGMCLSVTLMSVGCPYMLYFLPAYAISAGE